MSFESAFGTVRSIFTRFPFEEAGHYPFDFKVQQAERNVTIQAKLQRKKLGVPWAADKAPGLINPNQFVVETQKTRAGESSEGGSTRPYRFGEFDILAVSIEPATVGSSRVSVIRR